MTKKLDANYRENESKFNKLEVPTPGVSEAGKVLMVGEDGKLMYGEGGGSGSGGHLVIKSFTSFEEMFQYFDTFKSTTDDTTIIGAYVPIKETASSNNLYYHRCLFECYLIRYEDESREPYQYNIRLKTITDAINGYSNGSNNVLYLSFANVDIDPANSDISSTFYSYKYVDGVYTETVYENDQFTISNRYPIYLIVNENI